MQKALLCMESVKVGVGQCDSVETILNAFFNIVEEETKFDNSQVNSNLFNMLLSIWNTKKYFSKISIPYELKNANDSIIVQQLIKNIKQFAPVCYHSYIHYLLGELICNIQQHSKANNAWVDLWYNNALNCIELCVVDDGISIHGSYIENNVYCDKLEYGDASAINIARCGYSTKNRPEAENRGFGISTNMKIITDVLDGVFSICSGNALFLKDGPKAKILVLPKGIEWKGTIIIARLSLDNSQFNMYDYIY